MKKDETRLEKKKYSPPKIQEHRTLDKARGCGYYVSTYDSETGAYYH